MENSLKNPIIKSEMLQDPHVSIKNIVVMITKRFTLLSKKNPDI